MATQTHDGDRQGGFTLIELLVVMAILGVLTALILVGANAIRTQAKVASTAKRMDQIIIGLQTYLADRQTAAAALQQRVMRSVPRLAPLAEVLRELRHSRWSPAIAAARTIPAANEPPNVTGEGTSSDITDQRTAYGLKPTKLPIFRWDTAVGAYAMTGTNLNHYFAKPPEMIATTLEAYPYDQPPLAGAVPPNRPTTAWYRSTWPTAWPGTDWTASPPGSKPVIWATPWGRGEWKSIPTAGDGYDAVSGLDPRTVTSWADGSIDPAPAARNLADLSPLHTLALLQAAGVLEDPSGADEYRSNRSPAKPWNDAWGNPLIVVAAAFHPPRHDARGVDVTNDAMTDAAYHRSRDFLIHRARTLFGYASSVYLSVGAMGPTPAATTRTAAGAADDAPLTWTAGGDNIVLQQAWMDIRVICAAEEWNERAFSTPPWSGVRKRSGTDPTTGQSRMCLLQSPTEVK